jgi:hypothetical protein
MPWVHIQKSTAMQAAGASGERTTASGTATR